MKIVIMIVITLACWTHHSLVYCKAQVLNGFYWIKPMLLCFVHSVIVHRYCCCWWNISFSFEPFRKYVFTSLDCRIVAYSLVTYTIHWQYFFFYFFFCRLKTETTPVFWQAYFLMCFTACVCNIDYGNEFLFDVHFDRTQRETKSIDFSFNSQYFNSVEQSSAWLFSHFFFSRYNIIYVFLISHIELRLCHMEDSCPVFSFVWFVNH